jgi:filamentous hemagglutinin family protein
MVHGAGRTLAATQLPVPCLVGSCGTNATSFVSTGAASAVQSGKTLTVKQTSANATLNWASFNISADGKVNFLQPSSNSVALNRIFDANPSSIFGALTANGQIYLINANGFLFGAGSTVNVNGLIASSLNITDSTFASGILAPLENQAPALQQFVDATGAPVVNTGSITVQAGAQLSAGANGRLLLAAPVVTNGGTLTSPDGQIMLAAGQSLYLQANSTPDLRGLIVEVTGSGTVNNLAGGLLSSPRGNVTLAGLMVNQSGRISATTSVAANGSVILQAADGFVPPAGNTNMQASQGGTLEIGPTSEIDILPEYADPTTAVAAQTQLQSSIAISGQQVFMHGGTIDAPGGKLTVSAAANPSNGIQDDGNSAAQIRIDAGTNIDLAGSDATLPMSANLVTVQLRSNEFADDPTQRNGALRGTTVVIDVRADGGLGTPIADVSSAIAAVGQNIAQRTEAGGTASFQSEGDIIFNPGASINVSGGATTYAAGAIQTTSLIGSNGQFYDIGSANPLLTYTGVVNPTFNQVYNKWGVTEIVPTPGLSHFEASYQQGAAAGTVQFAAPSLLLSGSLQGTAINGLYQRTPGTQVPGGTLEIGLPGGVPNSSSPVIDFLAPSVALTASPIPVVVADGAPLPVQTLGLPAAYLTADGFTNTEILSNGTISIPAGLPLQLAPGASLTLEASRIDLNSSISSVGGNLNVQSLVTAGTNLGAGAPRLGVFVGDGVALDVSGQWTNDDVPAAGPNAPVAQIGTAPTLQNGGKINLQLTAVGSELSLGSGVSLTADGGAWVNSSGAITYGNGGAITLDASPAQSAIQLGAATTVQGFATGTATGGSFTLLAPRIGISQGTGAAWTEPQLVDELNSPGTVLNVFAPLFSAEGFSSVSLTATGAVASTTTNDLLTVAPNTTILAETETLQLQSNYQNALTGATLAGFTEAGLLPLYERPIERIALNVLRPSDTFSLGATGFGTLDIEAGAVVQTDPGGSILLQSIGSIDVAGTLRAPGGTISLTIPTPNEGIDPGYQPNQGILLTPTAVLDASGSVVMTPNSAGLQQGAVSPGGAVTLAADRGTVISAPGSSIDIAGTSASLDIANASGNGGYTQAVVASAGGSLTVNSDESISLLGNLSAAAGVGSTGTPAAGSLEVDLIRSQGVALQLPQLPGSTLQIDIVNSTAGATPSAANSEVAILGAQQLQQSGIDSLTLRVGGSDVAGNIFLEANSLTLGRQITLDTPNLSVLANATLSAPSVSIGNSNTFGASATPLAPAPSAGTLAVNAQQITLFGNTAIGAAGTTLTSAGDVQLLGTDGTNQTLQQTGSLVTNGNLTINADRVYPDTYTNFSLQSFGTGATVAIGQTSASAGTPLSADGSIDITADNIAIGGTLLAPFGSINLTANTALTLTAGSLLSVSGSGLQVPFGETQLNGADWLYFTANGTGNAITSVPSKQVSLTAPSVTVASGATVNLQGGGDLYAYEWVPGTGGSFDRLSSNPSTAGYVPGLYAILPAERGQAGPYDPEESAQAAPYQTVYLSAGAGLAAGYYALLPPRYALEPGAVLIQVEPSYQSLSQGQIGSLADGTPVLAGFLSSGTTGLRSGLSDYEGFAVYPSGYAQQLAAYLISNASTFFSAAGTQAGVASVPLPADAGTLSIVVSPGALPGVQNALNLQGSVETAAATGGRGADINISAPDLEIVAGAGGGGPGSIAVSASVLQGWNASALTLGGTTSTSTAADGTTVTDIAVAANSVAIDNGVQLSADQIDVVAQQSITVSAGATLASTSGKAGTTLATLPAEQLITLTDSQGNALPQGALLAVSDLNLPVVLRSGQNGANPATIDVAPGATLSSGGALAFDAPGSMALGGTISGKGASWSLGSSSIAFVGALDLAPDTLNIDSGLLAELQTAGAVRIASAGSIDLLAPVSLGAGALTSAPSLAALTLIGSGINNAAAGDSVFGAASLTLGGTSQTPSASAPAAGSGNLSLVAETMTVGPGFLPVTGFAHTTAQVSGAVEGQGAGGLAVGGDLTINAVELTAAPDATEAFGTNLSATGVLTLGAPTSLSAKNTLPSAVGGNLSLSGASIEDAGAIVVPSGLVTLSSAGDLHLAGSASINAAGTLVTVVDQTAPAPGGNIVLTAGGNLTLDAGSMLSVAGIGAAPAGSLSIAAPGAVSVAATLSGGAPTTGGSFTLDAGQLTGGGLPALAAALNSGANGGFTGAINLRVASGNLDLPAGSTLTANSVTLTADSGTVEVGGTISAPSGAQRGYIDLSGGASVVLDSTGVLAANGSGSAGRGGEIDINSTCPTCSITLAPGSVVSAAGNAQMGELVLRAPVAGTSDVAINGTSQGLGADVSAVGQVIVEPVMVFQENSGSLGADLGGDIAAATGFVTTATIASRLTTPSATPVNVQAGVEIQDASPGDSVAFGALDLYPYSSGAMTGQPVVVDLTVRAAGSITINGTISDGYVKVASGAELSSLPSGSLSFVAGADLSSADPTAVLAGSAAALTLASGPASSASTKVLPSVVRTGTGDITLAAAGDVVFAESGAAAYTGGEAPAGAAPITVNSNGQKQLINFGTAGGNVTVTAGGNITAAPVSGDNGNTSVTGWLIQQVKPPPGGSASQATARYGVDFDDFDWNLGALGGGDLTVQAAGSIDQLSAATSDSLTATGIGYGSGGGLRLTAGGDIGSAQVYVAAGQGLVQAGGGLTAVLPNAENASGSAVGSSFALGDAQIGVWARQSVQVDAVYNPTYIVPTTSADRPFFTYSANSSLTLSSTDGAVDLEPASGTTGLSTLLGANVVADASTGADLFALPANLNLQALQQSVGVQQGGSEAILFPSSTGQLVIFAGKDIDGTGGLIMADSPSFAYPTAAAPTNGSAEQSNTFAIAGLLQFDGVIHTGDPDPALITAGGSIENLSLSIPKAAQVVAGKDIVNLTYSGQNIGSNDTTLVSAGRDISFNETQGGIQVGGPGSLDVFAGRNIDLGVGDGIITVGNLVNDNLASAAGADVTVTVGYGSQGADLSNFVQQIITPSPTYQAQLTGYVEALEGTTGLTNAQAAAQFKTLSVSDQNALVDQVFFNELLLSGRAANSGSGVGFTEGYTAIDALFPNSRGATNPYSGNLSLLSSQIYTDSGGNISIVVPGGAIDVGLAHPPSTVLQKPASSLGIVAEGAGNVDIYSEGDVNVNSSRIFTLGGGNILIWSDLGSIDAGNGSKSSLSVPPPIVLINANGTVMLDFGGSLASGSGIRTIQTNSSVPPGNVDLDAPVGTVNAGDAGIGASGNINIAAAHVIGIDNINFGGTSTGVPSDISSLGASLSGVSAVASSATSSATSSVAGSKENANAATPLASSALSFLDVFVTGLGEENCKQDDIECLKRQQKASP